VTTPKWIEDRQQQNQTNDRTNPCEPDQDKQDGDRGFHQILLTGTSLPPFSTILAVSDHAGE